MKVVEKNIVTKRMNDVPCGSIVDYFDIAKGVVHTCLVGYLEDENKEYHFVLMDITDGSIHKVTRNTCVSHYTKATLLLEGE